MFSDVKRQLLSQTRERENTCLSSNIPVALYFKSVHVIAENTLPYGDELPEDSVLNVVWLAS